MDENERFGLGLIGCGSFGLFCLEAFSRMDGVRIAAVADTRLEAAEAAARRFGASACDDPAGLTRRDDVDIVHVATPPASHHPLAMQALRAGKHVLCEKPLATDLRQADEILAAAAGADRIVPVNFVMRYNEVTEAAKRTIDSGLLGRVLSGRATNCAFDTLMGPEHWFWNRDVSGGVFIEHGVHFFDLYRHWLGPGEVIDAHAEMREGTTQQDRVTCTVRHTPACGALVSHYHGFDQILPMDRADHRLVCELGDIRVEGWIPLTLTVDAAVDDAGAEGLAGCCPGAAVKVVKTYDAERAPILGRGKKRDVTKRICLRYTPQPDKQVVYVESVRALLADQIAYIRDRNHARRIGESDGRDALALAERAANLSDVVAR